MQELTEDQEKALAIARDLVSVGIPVFIAQPDPANVTGFIPPAGWQNTIPDSELPGLNARTQRNTERSTREYDHFDWNPNGPGIESEAPLPITEVIVVCG